MNPLKRIHRSPAAAIVCLVVAAAAAAACGVAMRDDSKPAPRPTEDAKKVAAEVVAAEVLPADHLDRVMTSRFCGECHVAIYAEHEQNTHGRAFTDEEVRLATGRFDHGDCIRCHTPRPIFETGIGMNPLRRFYGLEEGNTCMTCHWKPEVDYSRFRGGPECNGAFDPRVGEVEACASCHRNHGTPYQWEKAPTGKLAGNDCIGCHMESVIRPVAVRSEPTAGHSHIFPGCRNEKHVRKAYDYEAKLDGNAVVVKITNKGAGHNFPTELKQRAVESVVVVTDLQGKEVARSRLVFRDPYKRPYGLRLLVNTQIPPGESREHRVPISIASGTVRCELHFKFYYPIEDFHPDLARLLESRQLVFDGIEPSTAPIESAPDVKVTTPESVTAESASPANLVDFARPPIGKVDVEIPQGDDVESIKKLVELLQFPLLEANRAAQARLSALGEKAVPALIECLGSWDNKTFNQAMGALAKIGEPALPAVLAAIESDRLFVRYHARALLPRMGWIGGDEKASASLVAALAAPNALDRASSAECLGLLGLKFSIPSVRPLLQDPDPDVVRAAALALARLRDSESLAAMRVALARATYPEIRRDVAKALALLDDPSGVLVLLDGLDHKDDLIRESCFEAFFAVTGVHMGYEPLAPRDERLATIAKLQTWWAKDGGKDKLRHPRKVDPATHAKAWKLVEGLADPEGTGPPDEQAVEELSALGGDAVPALVLGLKYPAGFDEKRRLICSLLADAGDTDAVPALVYALRDPVVSVAAWACYALGALGDKAALPAVARFHDRVRTLAARGQIPAEAGHPDVILAHATVARYVLGQERAKEDLVRLLLSDDAVARELAITALEARFQDRRGYDPQASLEERRKAAKAWEG